MKHKILVIYTIFVSLLSILSVTLVILNFLSVINIFSFPYNIINISVTLIFSIDYIVRLIHSKNKKKFFINNIFDLIAILPVNTFLMFTNTSGFYSLATIARLCNLAKIMRLIRILNIASQIRKKTGRFLHTNGFIYVLYITLGFILISSVIISNLEGWTFENSIWFCFVTSATVGFGDMVPVSKEGKLIAIMLMLVGVALLGMLTGTITTYFSKKAKSRKMITQPAISDLIEASSCLSEKDVIFLTSIAKTINEGEFEISIKKSN